MSVKTLLMSSALVLGTLAVSGCVADPYASGGYDSYGQTYGSGYYVSRAPVYDRSPRYRDDDRYDRRDDRRDRYDRDRRDRYDRDNRDRRRDDDRRPGSPNREQARPASVQTDQELQERMAAEAEIQQENIRIQRQRMNSR